MTTLNQHDQTRKDNYIKKLVSNARSIISNQIALPLGAIKMYKILFWINQIETIEAIDLHVFTDYKSKISNFAIGTERLSYSLTFLKNQDKQLDEITKQYKDKLIEKCYEIINTFTEKKL